MPEADDDIVGFSEADAREIGQQVEFVRTLPRGGDGSPAGPNGFGAFVRIGKATSGIPAATSITAPGSAAVEWYDFNGGTAPADMGETFTAYNVLQTAVASGKTVVCAWNGGQWVVVVADC